MTAREAYAYSLGRDSAHCERRPTMSPEERASYPSQAATADALGDRLRRARVERWLLECLGVGARMRKDTARGRGAW